MRILLAPEGAPFIFIAIVATALSWFFGPCWLFYVLVALAIFVTAFFRDPNRVIPDGEDDLVSPADGRIIKIEEVTEGRLLRDKALLVSIFMNVFNVHVNRSPVNCKVEKILYNPGKFIPADRDKASLDNEQNALLMELSGGVKIVTNQIAGLVARRIVCRIDDGATLKRGERFGMIRFGSRLDVYLPLGTEVTVKMGEKVRAGSTILAKLKN